VATRVPVVGQTYTFGISLSSRADANIFQSSATIAAGDFQRSINGAAFANLDNLPTVTPAAGKRVQVVISAAETTAAGDGGEIYVIASDAAGGEYKDAAASLRVFATDIAVQGADGDTLKTLSDQLDAVETDTSAIGAAGAGLTALGDARLANLDAAVSSRGTADPGDPMTLANDTITSAKFDESTAFPLKAADAGLTYVARTGADSDTLETLSDQVDGIDVTGVAAAVWNRLLSAISTVGSIGKLVKDFLDAAISSRATPADVSCTVSLSETEAAEVATGSMALSLYGSFDQTVESDSTEDLSLADALIWAVKNDRKRDADAEALVLVDVATGLRYLARAAYTGSAANGSITLGGAIGAWEIRCQLTSGIPGQLEAWANRPLDAQIKAIFGDRTVNVWEGSARIVHQTIREV
jgi:hypothetical protein